MRTLDNVSISVPNQILLDTGIQNQSLHKTVRRKVTVTCDYSENPGKIRDILISAISKVDKVSKRPSPSVYITDFPSFALEYTLYYNVRDTQMVQVHDSEIREAVVNEFKANKIDMRTPNLIQSLK
jgi:small-conductance mechanosensitive channel